MGDVFDQAAGDVFDQAAGMRPDFAANPPGVKRPANPIKRDPTYHDYETIGASDGAALAEGLGEWDKASFGEMGGGAADVARGNFARGAHRMISGVGAAAVPALPFAAAAAPVPLVKAMMGGTLAQKVARSGAEGLGATPDQADLAGDIGGMAGGYGATKVPVNPGRLANVMWGATKGGVEKVPVLGPITKGAIRGGVRAYRDTAPELPDANQGLIEQGGGQPVETITDKPSGRLVLTPEEAQAETGQMRLAKKIASQRGMQYAAGMRPAEPSQ